MKYVSALFLMVLFGTGSVSAQCSVDLGSDTVHICQGDTLQFDAGDDWTSYLWSNGADTSIVNISQSGLITLEATDSLGCVAYDTVTVLVLNPNIATIDTVYCPGDAAVLEASIYAQVAILGSDTAVSYLPDGGGVNFSDTIDVSGFPPNASVEDMFDNLELCMIIEHSYLGDLEVMLTCPNGDSINIFNSFTGDGLFEGGFGGGPTYLGDALDAGIGMPGIGWEYCFSDLADRGTLGQEFAEGNTVPAPLSNGLSMNPGTYLPEWPLETLSSCQINGDWILTFVTT